MKMVWGAVAVLLMAALTLDDRDRAFSESSYWNTPLPADAPVHPNSDDIIAWLRADNDRDYLTLTGTGADGAWGHPIYWAGPGDREYDIIRTRYLLPPEFDDLRIPRGATPDPTSDAEMTVYDVDRGIVATLWEARYDPWRDRWSAGGGGVYYLASNGLAGSLARSDEPRNVGHRGLPPPVYAVRYDEIEAGAIEHVLKIAVNTTKDEAVFPMVGHEDGTAARWAPPEGTRIRIKPSVDLASLGLSPAAGVVARALQRYGAVIGDQSGGDAVLKVENTVAQGRGFLWDGVLTDDALAPITLDMFEVIRHGYEPPP